MAVKVYTTPTCPYCKKAKAWLKEHGVKFEEINVLENEAARHCRMLEDGAAKLKARPWNRGGR